MLTDAIRLILGPLLGAIIGGLVVHFAARRRDVENDRRRQRIDYLVGAYRVLAASAHRELSGQRAEAFEDAISEVVLLGNTRQIQLAREAITAFASQRSASLDDLLADLRNALRRELGLPADSLGGIPTIRIVDSPPDSAVRLQTGDLHKVDISVVTAATAAAATNAAFDRFDRTGATDMHRLSALSSDISVELRDLARHSPRAAIESGYALIAEMLIRTLDEGIEDNDPYNLAVTACDRGLISAQSVRTIQGLGILHAFAQRPQDGKQATTDQANDYLDLVGVTLYSIS